MRARQLQIVSPGRVNLLGEHVDKYGGKVLPVAIDKSIKLSAQSRTDCVLNLHADDLQEQVKIDLDQLDDKCDTNGNLLPTWAQYPAGVAWSLKRSGFDVMGADCSFTSNIPIGAGLSSSAALEVAFGVLWQELGQWPMDRLTLARYCQAAEVEYVGVNCGLMDQFACANGLKDHVMLLDTWTLEFRAISMPMDAVIVIADSQVRHSLVTSAYNDRVKDCQLVLEAIQDKKPAVESLRDASMSDLAEIKSQMPLEAFKHASHVVSEMERVDQAIQCLENNDSRAFGELMFATHTSLRDLYEVSTPELDLLVEIAASFEGCYGARLTGAGFGGCTVNLVKNDKAQAFADYLSETYMEKSGKKAPVYITNASSSASVV
jgi:galactokinase